MTPEITDIKYFDDNPMYGIEYDWDKVCKLYNSLGIPDNVYNPTKVHTIQSGKYIIDMSERNTGKSTNWMLFMLCVYKLYGSETAYVRELVDMLMPKHSMEIFKTILNPNYDYLNKLFDGRWNTIRYRSRRYFLANTETGEEDDKPFMLSVSVDENGLNKSSLQLPDTDLIFFDEFISKYNYSNEFVDFADTVKTIIRERDAPFIVMAANTLDMHSFWFKELEIYEAIQGMNIDEQKVITTDGGTVVDVAFIGASLETMTEHRKRHNAKFFGFKNPKLNAIRGGAWAVKMYPHPDREADTETVLRNRYISHNGFLLNLELMHNERHGYHVIVHEANQTYDDSIIYNLDLQPLNRNYKFKWGTSKVDKFLYKLLQENKFFYATNFCGTLIEDYIRSITKGDFLV